MTAVTLTFVVGLTVRLYDGAGLPPDVKDEALAVAQRTMASAGVEVAWTPCRAQGCDAPLRAGEVVLRLVKGPPTDGRSAPAALRSRSGLPLGDAFVDAGGGAGVLATIYVDRVQVLAEKAGTDVRALLGHAVAHELGHLLLASNRHGARGLMRALWSSEDLRRSRAADWRFTTDEAAAMRRRLGSGR